VRCAMDTVMLCTFYYVVLLFGEKGVHVMSCGMADQLEYESRILLYHEIVESL
jgi:hypothetical protein